VQAISVRLHRNNEPSLLIVGWNSTSVCISFVNEQKCVRSDYDLLIVTPSTFTPQEKIEWSSRIDRAIVKAISAPVDLLLNSEEEIRQKQQLPGHIIRSVMREGVAL
jgi:hypothetical protein